MRILRWLLVFGTLTMATLPVAAQRDPEKALPQILGPNPPVQPVNAAPERPAPALQMTFLVLSTLLILYILCKPSRKSA